jgi:hypothetical protein
VAWQRKGAASTSGPVVYLLHLRALHQWHHRYIPLHDFISFVANVLAEKCSRLFHLTDSQLLAHFNFTFPHTMLWQMFPLWNEEKIRLGVSAKRAKSVDAHWAFRETFCLKHNIDPFVQNCDEPVPIIKVFDQRYQDGHGAPNHNTVHSGTVEDATRVVGHVFTQLGAADARLPLARLNFASPNNFGATKRKICPHPVSNQSPS